MSFYDDMAGVASSLLGEFGQTVQFSRTIEGAYDPATLSTAQSQLTFSGLAVEVAYKNAEIDGQRILATDKKLVCERLSNEPLVGDIATVGGLDYRVMSVMPVKPAGAAVVYKVQLRL